MKYSKSEAEWREVLSQVKIDLVRYEQNGVPSSAVLTICCQTCKTEETVLASNLMRRQNHLCLCCAKHLPYTTENIKELIESYGGIYLGGKVSGKYSRVKLACPNCGTIHKKTAHDVRRTPTGCKHCKGKKISDTFLQRNQNLAKAIQVAEERGGRCLTKNALVNTKEMLLWECSHGHSWPASLYSVAGLGTWCGTCGTSISENMVRTLLEASFGQPFPMTRPAFLADLGLHLDGYNPELCLAFEHQGIQHFEKNARFHKTNDDLYAQMERDVLKSLRCQKNGVTLLVVPYSVTGAGFDSTRLFLSKLLLEAGIKPLHDPLKVPIDMRKIYDPSQDQAYLDFKQIVKEKGGRFEENSYCGLTKPIEITCKKGDSWPTSPHLIRNGNWCPACAGKKRLTTADVQKALQQEGWSLVDPEHQVYKNAHQILEMTCSCGNRINRTWNKWQQQQKEGSLSCINCRREGFAREFLAKMEDRGYLMDVSVEEYIGEGQEVKGICLECGEESTLRVEMWKSIAQAPCCGRPLPAYHPCYDKSVVPAA